MQSEYRLHPYTVPRDVRIMVHPHVTAVSEQPRAADGVVKVPPASKTPQQPGKEAAKTTDAKAAPAPTPHSEARILTVTPSNQLQGLPLSPPVVVTHGVQIVHSSGGELFQEYRYGDIRTYHGPAQLTHTQFPATASIGLPSRTKAPTQVRASQISFPVQIVIEVPVWSLKYVTLFMGLKRNFLDFRMKGSDHSTGSLGTQEAALCGNRQSGVFCLHVWGEREHISSSYQDPQS